LPWPMKWSWSALRARACRLAACIRQQLLVPEHGFRVAAHRKRAFSRGRLRRWRRQAAAWLVLRQHDAGQRSRRLPWRCARCNDCYK
jgi:hypothetical protein